MKTYKVGEFKAHFSDILSDVKNGESVTISYGKKGEKLAVVVPYQSYRKRPRKLGLLEGKAKCIIRDDFEMTDEEFWQS